jgi:hypothetical protein
MVVICAHSVIPSGWQDIDYGEEAEGIKSEQVGNP